MLNRLNAMLGDTLQLKNTFIMCFQGFWDPVEEKEYPVSNSKITHCAILISVSFTTSRKHKPGFWYCIGNICGHQQILDFEPKPTFIAQLCSKPKPLTSSRDD